MQTKRLEIQERLLDQGFLYLPDFINYMINDQGTIISLNTHNPMKYNLNNCGYPIIWFRKDNKNHKRYVHRVVAEMFVPNPDPLNKIFVDHINRNRLDFRAINLRWTEPSENSCNREKWTRVKFTCIERICKETGKVLGSFNSLKEASQAIGVNISQISNSLNSSQSMSVANSIWRYRQ